MQRSLLPTNVRVQDHGLIEDSVILPDVEIGRDVTLRRVIVDKGCLLPGGFAASVHIARDRARFLVPPRGISLISRSMLEQETCC